MLSRELKWTMKKMEYGIFFYTKIYLQFPITAIREIKILKGLDHKNIVKLENMLVSKRMKLSLK